MLVMEAISPSTPMSWQLPPPAAAVVIPDDAVTPAPADLPGVALPDADGAEVLIKEQRPTAATIVTPPGINFD